MGKKGLLVFILFLMTIGVLGGGGYYYQAKVNKTGEKAQQQYQADLLKEQQRAAAAKAEKEKEAKQIYEKHKGKELVYLPIGSSLTAGNFATKKSKTYVSVLARLIHKNLGYDVKTIEGYGKSGTGLKDNGTDSFPHLIANKPDLVTIEFGTFDLNPNAKNTYVSADKFKKNLENFIEEMRKGAGKKIKIILVTTWNSGQSSLRYDREIQEVGKAEDVPVANIESVWMNRTDTYGPKGEKAASGKSDGWLANDKGHKEIADVIYSQAYRLLK
ncbi:hypothetical protein BpJC7_31390 [Weizmannia acidilactici]|uniref:SGNH hydrolase-type esterase domain-containing protein n=1 Tax=Weizmannia acidilactici TaxID=2607726 RepID=A0A5J4JAQ7_9BACI|nr:SGNH/GDSL hydrolase family protein [Weizmannia acidilactici]GER71836.1 hypothetical protein BpJC7_31390 [Weizmannia acidilactici]